MELYNTIAANLYRVMDLGEHYKSYNYYTTRERYEEVKASFKIDYKDGKVDYTGKPSVYGAHLLNKSEETLVITQGEESCIALRIIDNELECVGSPKIQSFDWLANSMKLMESYKKIIVLGDNDWQLEIYRRLCDSHEIMTIDNSVLNGARSVYDAYMTNCIGDIDKELQKPISLKIDGILTVDDLRFKDWKKTERIYTGFNDIDAKALGLQMGLTSLWCGSTGMGKSTVVNKLVLNAMQQDYRCCVYSGEQDADGLYSVIGAQACSKDDVINEAVPLWDGTLSSEYMTSITINGQSRFRSWAKGRLFVKNNDYTTDNECDNIISIFEKAYKMHNCRLFVVDNLMSILARHISDDTNAMQTYLMNKLVEFAVRCNVHVIIVAHFRKTKSGEKTGNNDVAGSSNVPNMAGSVYSVKKFDTDEQAKVNEICEKNSKEAHTGIIQCSKNRSTGKLFDIKTRWDNNTRQVYGFGDRVVKYNMYNDEYAMKEVGEWK